MKKYLVSLCLQLSCILSSVSLHAQDSLMKLWYTQPAGASWVNALPMGNGRLGVMVFGNPGEEQYALNEATIWTGSPNRNDNPDALKALPEIRRLVFEGHQQEAQDLASHTMQTHLSNGQIFQPAGNLYLSFPGHDNYTDYYRELSLATATSLVRYKVGNTTFTRRSFVSIPAGVLVIRLEADRPAALSFTAHMNSPQRNISQHVAGNELFLSGTTGAHETVPGDWLKFQAGIKILQVGGALTATDTSLTIKGATSATILLSIGTNFVNYHDGSADAATRCEQWLSLAAAKTYGQLLKDHMTAYRRFFDRVRLDLGTTAAAHLPTDRRLQQFADGDDPQFISLYFQFGRYLLIASSQPGGQPANLQGIWNNQMKAPWDAKYTININTEMNYWPAEKDNLPEMHEPLIQMVKELAVTGQGTARSMYGARGWMAHHNTDLWRITGPVDAIFWGVWSMGGAWLCQHLWEKYCYSGDLAYLRSIYPVLKEAALFFVDDLQEEPTHHWLVINPGTSPENHPSIRPGVSFDAGTTMDNQIVFDMLSVAIHAARTLHTDSALVDTFINTRRRLPPMHIGRYGQLQEWLEDLDDPNDHHRHISHLYGLYPSAQISPLRTPALFSAAHTTILERGDISTGWSMGWKVNWWARFLDGDHALQLIRDQLSPVGTHKEGGGTYPNLFDAHPPFQIDGNFGCTSGITEMLMQSQDGAIQLLPALPAAWSAGSIEGLRARGGFEIVSLVWKDHLPAKLVIRSHIGGVLRIRISNKVTPSGPPVLHIASGDNPNPLFDTDKTPDPIVSPAASIQPMQLAATALYDLPTRAGQVYTIVFK